MPWRDIAVVVAVAGASFVVLYAIKACPKERSMRCRSHTCRRCAEKQ